MDVSKKADVVSRRLFFFGFVFFIAQIGLGQSIVVKTSRGHGSAFVLRINESNVLVTASHVLRGKAPIEIIQDNGAILQFGKIIYDNPEKDLSFSEISGSIAKIFLPGVATTGASAKIEIPRFLKIPFRAFILEYGLLPKLKLLGIPGKGFSGSPILDEDKKVIGIQQNIDLFGIYSYGLSIEEILRIYTERSSSPTRWNEEGRLEYTTGSQLMIKQAPIMGEIFQDIASDSDDGGGGAGDSDDGGGGAGDSDGFQKKMFGEIKLKIPEKTFSEQSEIVESLMYIPNLQPTPMYQISTSGESKIEKSRYSQSTLGWFSGIQEFLSNENFSIWSYEKLSKTSVSQVFNIDTDGNLRRSGAISLNFKTSDGGVQIAISTPGTLHSENSFAFTVDGKINVDDNVTTVDLNGFANLTNCSATSSGWGPIRLVSNNLNNCSATIYFDHSTLKFRMLVFDPSQEGATKWLIEN